MSRILYENPETESSDAPESRSFIIDRDPDIKDAVEAVYRCIDTLYSLGVNADFLCQLYNYLYEQKFIRYETLCKETSRLKKEPVDKYLPLELFNHFQGFTGWNTVREVERGDLCYCSIESYTRGYYRLWAIGRIAHKKRYYVHIQNCISSNTTNPTLRRWPRFMKIDDEAVDRIIKNEYNRGYTPLRPDSAYRADSAEE